MGNVKLELKNSGIEIKNILEYSEIVENIHKDLHKRANEEKILWDW